MLEEIESLVQEILSRHEGPWPTDITDRIFCAIEENSQWHEQYQRIVQKLNAQGKRGQQVVNQYIGRRVKQLTTGVNRGRSYSPRSSLIRSYERH